MNATTARELVEIAQREVPEFPLRPYDISAEIAESQRKWGIVGKAWISNAPQCEECSFCRVTVENHPYGMGTAPETLADCSLGELASHTPEMCPAFQSSISEREEA